MRGADLLSQSMAQSKIEIVFSLSGNQIMPLYDAFLEPGIRVVHTRHENAAVFMADAFAQVTGGTGVALVTAAPGFANALGALYSAQMAESPVIFLSGDSPTKLDGHRAFQELDQCTAVAPFVKNTERVNTPRDLPDAWQRAVQIAHHGRPGPVHLALPFDVLCQTLESTSDEISTQTQEYPAGDVSDVSLHAKTDEVTQLLSALEAAERPLILTGPALNHSRAGALLSELQQHTSTPVICMESPRGLADPSLGQLGALLSASDHVVLLGKKPDFTLAYASQETVPTPNLTIIEPEADELRQTREVLGDREHNAIQAGPREFIAQLLDASSVRNPHTTWFSETQIKLSHRVNIDETINQTGMHPALIAKAVSDAIQTCDEAILVCDGGEFGQWAQAFANARHRVINGPSGAIGASLSYAIAARIARPSATVFALLGDGTAGFHLSEFETSVRECDGIIAVIGNDSCWNAEHQIQLRDYGEDRTHSCLLGDNTRYDQSAAGLGAEGLFASTLPELESALASAMKNSECGDTTCINALLHGLPAPAL